MTPVGHSIYRFRRQSTRVATDLPMHIEWLTAFLAPQFDLSLQREPDWSVTFSADADCFEDMHAQGPHPSGERVPFFALDSRQVELPRWNGSRSDELVGYDEEFAVFYGVGRDAREVRVLAGSARIWTRIALMRVVRELAMEEARRDGCLCLHAAAFDVDGRTFLIAGPKHAGKTTLLIHALSDAATRLVANDRVIVERDGDAISARGMPTLVSIRPGTRRLIDGVLAALEWTDDHACLAASEAARNAGKPLGPGDRMLLRLDQFASLFGKAQVRGGRLAAIVFPVIDPRARGLQLSRMMAGEAGDALMSSRFGTHTRSPVIGPFADLVPDGESNDGDFRRLLIREIPMLRCSLGPFAYRAPGGGQAFIEELARCETA